MVDYKFMDFVGTWRHVSVPITGFDEDTFGEGQGFDDSSIRGWQPIHASDMILLPDPPRPRWTRSLQLPTLSLIYNIFDPITKETTPVTRVISPARPRAYLKSAGIGDFPVFGPQARILHL